MTLQIADTTRGHDAFERMAPHSVEAEMCLLASMMLDRDLALSTLGIVDGESFYLADHKIIFDVIRSLIVNSKPVDAVIVREELKKCGQFEAVGGTPYIAQILSAVPSAAHGIEYANRVREHAMLRRVINIADAATRRAYDQAANADALIGEMQSELTRMITMRSGDQVQTLGAMLAQAVRELRDPTSRDFTSYGFAALDKHLMGIDRGEYVVVGARPSMGKSTFLRQMAVLSALGGTPTLFVSLEENPSKVGRNVLAWLSGTENQRIRRGEVVPHEMALIEDAAAKLAEVPFWFVWGVNKADAIQSLIHSYATRFGVKACYLDYLQLVDAGGRTDFEKATNASRAVSSIPKKTGVRTIAAAQLSRATAMREDHRPTMTDLRSTGQIEQDADVILLLHREDYYHTNDPAYAKSDEAEVIIAKARDSERGETVRLKSCLAYQCFEDIDPHTEGRQTDLEEYL